MKRTLLVGLAVGVMMLGVAGISKADTILFQDNFNSGVMSSEWVSIQGQQWVANGKLYTQDQDGWPRDSQALVHDGDHNWTDYTVSMTVDPIETWVTDANILFRTDGFNRSSSGTFGSAYQLDLINNPGDSEYYVRLWRTRNGAWETLYLSSFSIPIGPMSIDVSANGSNIKAWIDGSLMFDLVDSNPLLYGGVGVHNIWESIGSYDDVVVTSAAAPVPEPATILLFGSGLTGLIGTRLRKKKK